MRKRHSLEAVEESVTPLKKTREVSFPFSLPLFRRVFPNPSLTSTADAAAGRVPRSPGTHRRVSRLAAARCRHAAVGSSPRAPRSRGRRGAGVAAGRQARPRRGLARAAVARARRPQRVCARSALCDGGPGGRVHGGPGGRHDHGRRARSRATGESFFTFVCFAVLTFWWQLRDEYDALLAERLDEQWRTFAKFNEDQLHAQLARSKHDYYS
jgi:hypothetical protein